MLKCIKVYSSCCYRVQFCQVLALSPCETADAANVTVTAALLKLATTCRGLDGILVLKQLHCLQSREQLLSRAAQ
jgi:hypothetical protein